MRYTGTRNPRAEFNPLRSIPLIRPAAAVFRTPDLAQAAEWALSIARRDLPRAEEFFAITRANLGDANRSKASLRRARQAKAMKMLNQARAELRAARKALARAKAALTMLDISPLLPGLEQHPQRPGPRGPAWPLASHATAVALPA